MKHETTFRNVVPFNQLSKKDFGFHSNIFSPKLAIFLEIGIFFTSKLAGFCDECIKHTIDGAVDGLHSVISGDFRLRFDALIRLIAFHSLNLINEEKIPLIFPIWVS